MRTAFAFAICCSLAAAVRYDLGGTAWEFRSENGSIRGSATVPGDIYNDLQNAGVIGEPLFGERDVELRWVPRTNWVYEREFNLPVAYLYATGIDTVASITLNDVLIGTTHNQFLEYRYDIGPHLKPTGNVLRISFQSPVTFAKNQSDLYKAQYSHSIPPDCSPDVYNGECHANFIRKAQASFSWDWGPSFPTVGIWRPIYLEIFDTVRIERVSPLVTLEGESFVVQTEVSILCSPNVRNVQLSVSIPELQVEHNSSIAVSCAAATNQTVTASVLVKKKDVKLWYPRGYGLQKLYILRVLVQANGDTPTKRAVRIGFRAIELVQDLVNEGVSSKGRHFYFKVNGIPIFLKGTNWIPVSSFVARDNRMRRRFQLDSLLEANMNSIRIWGGGLYEDDDFYEQCDRKGILIWHDFMFACAAYPTNALFLDSVKEELQQQVYRLRHRPSILVWGGNNENELAIQTGWWFELGYPTEDMIKDYKILYKDLMKPLVTSLDPSRPFVMSSPSDGVESESQGGLAKNPGEDAYGDVHFYSESINLWKDQSYPIPRCATEYGVQSIPLRSTMLKWISASEWHYGSKSMTQRQHHPGGVINQLLMAFQHFELPSQCGNVSPGDLLSCNYVKNSEKFMDQFAFLSQLHQSVAIQTETEHYRRWRSRLGSDGRGNTMCAMYWQLNDVWAAPTWSSIDFNLRWKPLHYAARRFFDAVALSMYVDQSNTLNVFAVSDLPRSLSDLTYRLDMLAWSNGLMPVYTYKKTLNVPGLASTQIPLKDDANVRLRDSTAEDFVIRAQLFDSVGEPVTFASVLVPDKLHNYSLYGDLRIRSFSRLNESTYSVTLDATSIVPFVWLDLREPAKDTGLLFWFSDNAFVMTAPATKITLLVYENPRNVTLSVNDLTVCSLKNCGK